MYSPRSASSISALRTGRPLDGDPEQRDVEPANRVAAWRQAAREGAPLCVEDGRAITGDDPETAAAAATRGQSPGAELLDDARDLGRGDCEQRPGPRDQGRASILEAADDAVCRQDGERF